MAELQAVVFALEWSIQSPRQTYVPILGRILRTFWVVTDSKKAFQRLETSYASLFRAISSQ